MITVGFEQFPILTLSNYSLFRFSEYKIESLSFCIFPMIPPV